VIAVCIRLLPNKKRRRERQNRGSSSISRKGRGSESEKKREMTLDEYKTTCAEVLKGLPLELCADQEIFAPGA
jgi:hypothetical protein